MTAHTPRKFSFLIENQTNMSLHTTYCDSARPQSSITSAAKLGAKVGLVGVIPASLAGTGVAIATTGTVTSAITLAGGLLAGAATFCACAGVGVALGAGVGVVVGAVVSCRKRQREVKELTMFVTRTDVDII